LSGRFANPALALWLTCRCRGERSDERAHQRASHSPGQATAPPPRPVNTSCPDARPPTAHLSGVNRSFRTPPQLCSPPPGLPLLANLWQIARITEYPLGFWTEILSNNEILSPCGYRADSAKRHIPPRLTAPLDECIAAPRNGTQGNLERDKGKP